MLYIILYWIYLFFVTSVYGNSIVLALGVKRTHAATIPIFGTFVITIFASIYALFDGLSASFELLLLLSTIVISYFTRKSYAEYLKSIKSIFIKFDIPLRCFVILILFLTALKSAGIPFIVDNETYYVPTIKWLDQYGFVTGLANLHLFLGQSSGWHIAQSALNLNYLYSNFNDLNGFFLVVTNLYFIDKLSHYFHVRKFHLLAVGLFPIFYVLLFQFVSTPSPDLPIYLITVVLIGEFFESLESNDSSRTSIMFLMAVFASYIKLTSVLLFIFPLYVLLKNGIGSKKEAWKISIIAILVVVLFFIKNLIISGYPIYPLTVFALEDVDWVLPLDLLGYIVESTNSFGFYLSTEDYILKNNFELFFIWIRIPGLHGYFNMLWIFLLVVFPVTLFFKKNRRQFFLIYAVSLVQFIILWFTSPQYRFYLGYLMILSLIILALLLNKRMLLIRISLILSAFTIIITTFFTLSLTGLTENKSHSILDSFEIKFLVAPHSNSKYDQAIYETAELDGTTFFTPLNIDFFWAVGDCPLPCIQVEQYDYFRYYFKLVPAMRTEDLKDGFYSKKILNNDFELAE